MILLNPCALILSLDILGRGLAGVTSSQAEKSHLAKSGLCCHGLRGKAGGDSPHNGPVYKFCPGFGSYSSWHLFFPQNKETQREEPSTYQWHQVTTQPDRSCLLNTTVLCQGQANPATHKGLPKRNLMINNIFFSPPCRWRQLLWTVILGRKHYAPLWTGRVRLHLPHQMEAVENKSQVSNSLSFPFFFLIILNSSLFMKWHNNTMPREIHTQQCSLPGNNPQTHSNLQPGYLLTQEFSVWQSQIKIKEKCSFLSPE